MVISSFDFTSFCAGERGIVSGFCSWWPCGCACPEPSHQHPLQPAACSCRQSRLLGEACCCIAGGILCRKMGSWNLLMTWCIDPGALIYPSAFPSQVSVLLQQRRHDLGHELKETERCKAKLGSACMHASLSEAEAPGKGLQEQQGAACSILPPCRHLSCF